MISEQNGAIIGAALIVGVPSLISALASLSNRRHLKTGNGSSAGEYLPIIAASVSTLGDEQSRVRDALAIAQIEQATALAEARDEVKAEVTRASVQWAKTLEAHTASDQANFEELRSLIAPSPE